MNKFRYLFISTIIFSGSFVSTGYAQKVKDYLGVPGPVEFNKTKFNLAWTSHPSATYYKQEYTTAQETPEKFTKMIMIEAVSGEFKLQDIVKAKTNELDGRKSTDPLSNYKVIENKATGEYLLDFILSANNQAIVEWNAYRYKLIKDKSGKKGLMLFAYSRRAYGSGADSFLKALQKERTVDIQAVAVYPLPAISLGK